MQTYFAKICSNRWKYFIFTNFWGIFSCKDPSECPLHKGAEKSTVILHYKQNCHVSISSILDIVEVDVDVEQQFNNLSWGTIN